MDSFAAALANLEKTAEQASRRSVATTGRPVNATEQSQQQSDRRRGRSDSPHRRNTRGRLYGPGEDRSRGANRWQSSSSSYQHDSNSNGGSRQNYHHNNSHSNRNNNPIENFQRTFGYRLLPPYQPLPPLPQSNAKAAMASAPKHIALLAITIDDLPYEHIWKAWVRSQNNRSDARIHVSLLCHAKYPENVKSPWLKRRLLIKPPQLARGNSFADVVYHTHRPEWGSVQITRAMIDLLVAGMEIGNTANHHSSSSSSNNNNNNNSAGIASSIRLDREQDVRFSRNRFWMDPDAPITDTYFTPTEVEATDSETNHSGHLKYSYHEPLPTLEQLGGQPLPPVDKFIYMSETCLPITSLSQCVEQLFSVPTSSSTIPASSSTTKTEAPTVEQPSSEKDESKKAGSTLVTVTTANPYEISWVNARCRQTPGTPRNKYERDQFDEIRRIPGHCRWKADQWCVLSRPHVEAILQIDRHLRPGEQLWTCFGKINASDEMYIPTSLALLGILSERGTTSGTPPQEMPCQVWKRPVTYTDWSQGVRNPTTFTRGVRDLERIVQLQTGCLMARKFSPTAENVPPAAQAQSQLQRPGEISVEEWERVVLRNRDSSNL